MGEIALSVLFMCITAIIIAIIDKINSMEVK